MAGLVANKVAVVTGAGSGIGRTSALAFVREGAKVVLGDVDDVGGVETVKLVEQAGGAIVTTASYTRLVGIRNSGTYVAAKHGIIGLSKTRAIELASKTFALTQCGSALTRRLI